MLTSHSVLERHLAAFNRHDTAGLMATLAEDVTWRTGRDTIHGRAAVAELFDDWLWALNPSLTLLGSVAESSIKVVQSLRDWFFCDCFCSSVRFSAVD